MLLEVGVDSGAHGGMEARGTEVLEQLEALQHVLDRILHFGEPKFDARCAQRLLQLGEHVRRSHVDAGDWLGGDDDPPHRRRRLRHGLEHTLMEQLGIGKEQRCVPAEQHQAGMRLASG